MLVATEVAPTMNRVGSLGKANFLVGATSVAMMEVEASAFATEVAPTAIRVRAISATHSMGVSRCCL